MTPFLSSTESARRRCSNEIPWQKLYDLLRPYIKRWVYSSGIPSWHGQEDDIVEDILQEALLRVLKYAQQAESGEVAPIDSLENLSIVIAGNCCKDMKRRDRRLIRIALDEQSTDRNVVMFKQPDASEIALDNVLRESLFVKLSEEIIKFPYKQRKALLIDLANLMHFTGQPTSLQQAFLKGGVQLQHYQQALSNNPVERSRHAANLSLAYKKIGRLASVQEYTKSS